nr:protein NDR1-like [Tanacetum cinerariifolium]
MTRPDDSPTNFTIPFHLKLKNKNKAVDLHYPGPITVTFSYFPNVSMMVPLADYKLDSFYQGNGKTKHVRDFVETNIFPTVLEATDMIAFRVDTVATYTYKKVGRRRHRVEWGCVVAVNGTTRS